MASTDKVYLLPVQYSDHADPTTLRLESEGFLAIESHDRSAPGRRMRRRNFYRESIRSHNTRLNARAKSRKEERKRDGERE